MVVEAHEEEGNTSRRTRTRVAFAVTGTVVLAGVVALGSLTQHWARELTAAERLLPGTHVAAVDVGGQPIAEARSAVADAVTSRLERTVTVQYGDRAWQVSPRELGASADVDGAVDEAFRRGANAGPLQVAAVRWLGGRFRVDVDAPIEVPTEPVAAFVEDIAEDVDVDVRDATARWDEGDVEIVEHRRGRRVDQQAAASEVTAALERPGGTVPLTVDSEAPARRTEEVETVLPAVRSTARTVIDRSVTLALGDERWYASAGELGAEPDMERILASKLAAYRQGRWTQSTDSPGRPNATLPVDVSPERLADYVETLAGEIDRSPHDAHLDWSTGSLRIVPEHDGRTLDVDVTRRSLAAALRGATDRVELTVDTTAPNRTASAYEHVLFLRQNERRLYHYVGGEVARSWPVAVGGGGSPTPTGEFVVGAKRHRPTWRNPSPGGWGQDMPAVIGPGRDNPLGLRALNWNRGGSDTLIRFHGTAQVSSIGTGASRGCVRLTNDDVIELYERVPQGTPIVSSV